MVLDNINIQELGKFSKMADDWWNPEGCCRPLHAINPLRLRLINSCVNLLSQPVLDIGCGGGLLTELLARQGALVTGIDASPELIEVANQHAQQQELMINYTVATAESWCKQHRSQFFVVTCLELLEHVPDFTALIQACSQLTQLGGHVFFSTLNRSPLAYFLAILGAEYFLKLLPKGTHAYRNFIRPAELATAARLHGLQVKSIRGLAYNPLIQRYYLTRNVSVQYWVHCQKF